ncbi:hypothetical protein HMPREF9306_01462 [Propionimicrobium lymphophilum ACS-093-V-SCH5]|uniref:HTH cro/C1-type domain-containing protein n=2 Tax=Propionimicrobium TaxID=203133 RepID=S2VYH1_9ACTN|nr:hypothetical protein HMPREF9306_01462 [Propionimicrobium lymphophilum ACS-093-V-SCH5]
MTQLAVSPEFAGLVPQLTVSWRLRMAMEQAGMTQGDLAEAIGTARKTVGRWIAGNIRPPRGQLMACAMATGVPYVWLDKGIDPSQVDSGLSDQLPRLDSNQEPSD